MALINERMQQVSVVAPADFQFRVKSFEAHRLTNRYGLFFTRRRLVLSMHP